MNAASVLSDSARQLASRGSTDAALAVAEELRLRFADDPSFKVQGLAAAALALIAAVQDARGQFAAAIATYDEALGLVAASKALTRRGAGVALLLAKAQLLGRLGRREEAIVLLDGTLSAIGAATAGEAALRTQQAAVAAVAKLDSLCALDRYAEARELGRQLRDVLSEVMADTSSDCEPTSPVASESLLAAELAEIVNGGECWAVFEAREQLSLSQAAERAVRLYSVSDPWAFSPSATAPANAAAAIVRGVADGYALLSRAWTPPERSELPLPRRAELERHQLMRQLEVDSWASALGHPLRLADQVNVARSPTPMTGSDAYVVSVSVARDLVKYLYMWELVHILSASDVGSEALRDKQLSEISISYLRYSLDWHRKAMSEGAPAGPLGVAIACWGIAERFFAVTHRKAGSATERALTTEILRELLHETRGYAWLVNQNVVLPFWTEPGEAK